MIEAREGQLQMALHLLDGALAHLDGPALLDREITDEMEARMGQRIETQGCTAGCGGTMYKTVDLDDAGNPTSSTTWVCGKCGACA
ncbi:hypothetical protein [Streptomyces sp. NPDC008125]|uniref:hypothetical protein n=1 Tax=Streptomyces sp. NPDC008125 TaxID=3364811 RepID=UPI0036E8FCCE